MLFVCNFAPSNTMLLSVYTLGAMLAVACAQQYHTTPVPILRQLNKHNEDGSYSYGYEGADGSFKIETKYANGEVYGKYGYIDDTGNKREIEYGATKRGFEPVGSGIKVAPPTLSNNNNYVDYDDDGQYREDPSMYYKSETSGHNNKASSSSTGSHAATFTNFNLPASGRSQIPQQQTYHAPAPQQQNYYQPAPQPAPYHAPVHHHQPAAPARVNQAQFHGHPATNIDIASGSYTINYTG
ncbi:hypothetical protein B566_EDAN015649 [Ephemera danica]|nr:hypothetical protein B566_EDAN015649 [Ephemera danica]